MSRLQIVHIMMSSIVKRRDGVIWAAIISRLGKFHSQSAPYNPHISSLEIHKVYSLIYHRLSIGVKKPNTLKYSEYMIKYCMSLKEEMEYPVDANLLYLIQLQRLAEEVYETFHLEKLSNNTQMEMMRLQTHVKVYNTRLQEWRASLPLDIQKSRMLTLLHSWRMALRTDYLI